jgi:hypothetical protein
MAAGLELLKRRRDVAHSAARRIPQNQRRDRVARAGASVQGILLGERVEFIWSTVAAGLKDFPPEYQVVVRCRVIGGRLISYEYLTQAIRYARNRTP